MANQQDLNVGIHANEAEQLILREEADGMATVASNSSGTSITACSSELNLFYLCFAILGDEMKAFSTINAIIDAAVDRALETFLNSDYRNVRVLLQLSGFPQVQERMYPKLKDVMYFLVTKDETNLCIALKEGLTEVLRNLSRNNANKQAIYSVFLDTLFEDLVEGKSLRIKRFALGTLNNLATLEDNAVALLRKPLFIDTILDLTLHGGTPTIRERALWTLQSLACADENESQMVAMPRLVDTLLWCVEEGDTSEIKSYAIETVRNLANQNRQKLVENRRLMCALLSIVSVSSSSATLREMSFSCFTRLGYTRSQVNELRMLETLCIPRDAPRLATQGCRFNEIPNELIRKIGESLYGRGGPKRAS